MLKRLLTDVHHSLALLIAETESLRRAQFITVRTVSIQACVLKSTLKVKAAKIDAARIGLLTLAKGVSMSPPPSAIIFDIFHAL